MIPAIIVVLGVVFISILIALIYVEEQLAKSRELSGSKEHSKTPDLETIRQVVEAYDRLRAMYGNNIGKFIDRAAAVRDIIMSDQRRANKKTNNRN